MRTTKRVLFGALALAALLMAATVGFVLARRTAAPSSRAENQPALLSRQSSIPTQHPEPLTVEKKSTDRELPATPAPNASVVRRPESPSRQMVRATGVEPAPNVASPKTEPAPQAPDHVISNPNVGLSSSSSAAAQGAAPSAPEATPHVEDRVVPDPLRPEPPQKVAEELVVPADSVIGLQADTLISSERARVEDRVEAHVTRDVRVRDMVAIPAGTRALGSVIQVERGGKFRDRARIGIRFHTLVMADGTRLLISTETIYRDGGAPGNESAAKIGGATVAGTILGAIIGGGKGAGIGATAGAAAGTGAVLATDRSTAVLRAGEPMTVRILSPVSVTLDK